MSYVEKERSTYGGQPLELYKFTMDNSLWKYTSADVDVPYGEDDYKAVYISRGKFTNGGDSKKATLEVEVSANNPVALLFRSGGFSASVFMTIYRHHWGDDEYPVFWKGRVVSCEWDGSIARLHCETMTTMFQRAGLRRVYQVGCPHALYSANCGVILASYAINGTVVSVNGNMVNIAVAAGYATGYFTGGMIKFGIETRFIVAHSGQTITLVDGLGTLAIGSPVTIWPGCSHDITTCISKFNNVLNYGGLPYLPLKNPFSGDAIV